MSPTHPAGPLRAGVFPERACDLLAAADVRGRLFHDVNWGGYLGYRRFPEQQVYADGRWLLAGEDSMADYPRLYLRRGPPHEVEAAYDAYGIEVLVLPTRDVLRLPAVPPSSWRLAYVDETAAVMLRPGAHYDGNRSRLCELYRRAPRLAERARWPVAVRRTDSRPSPTDVPSLLGECGG